METTAFSTMADHDLSRMTNDLWEYNASGDVSVTGEGLGGGATQTVPSQAKKLGADRPMATGYYGGEDLEYASAHSDVDAAVPGLSPPQLPSGTEADQLRVPTGSPQLALGRRSSRRARKAAKQTSRSSAESPRKKLFRPIGSTPSGASRPVPAISRRSREITVPGQYDGEARGHPEDSLEVVVEEEEEMEEMEEMEEEEEEFETESTGAGADHEAGTEVPLENLFDPAEEASLRALLVEKQHELAQCTRKTSNLPAPEKKRLRNRHASCVSRIKKKLLMYNLQRELEASREDMAQLNVQVQGQMGTIRYFQQLSRDLVDRLRAYEPDYMPPVGLP